ncbi:hypothetical protein HZY88_08490 [Aerococcaceae bacterium DSM 111176]|nr:hypothetical protein [Aerococcaceae bacterium DSM 111176]
MSKEFNNMSNPANNFIKKGNEKDTQEEPRSKQMSILVKPSTHERLKLASSLENNSVNGIINDVLEAYLEENKEAIEAYIKVYEKFRSNLDDIN